MRVLHVAPLWLPVGTATPGGIETFLAQLCRAQVRQGLDVTLLAAGDSDADLPVVPVVPECAITVMGRYEAYEYEYFELEALVRAAALAADFDVVHSHLGPTGLAIGPLTGCSNVVHTQHGQVTDDLKWWLGRHPEVEIVALSEAQASALRSSGASVRAVVHNGVATTDVPFCASGGDDLVFLGRIEPAKGADLAIEVAERAGCGLRIAGPIIDGEFYDAEIAPRLNGRVSYEGVVVGADKFDLLGHAACALMPSRWNEPFGMVAIEAMTTGTPVVALASGALPEIIETGVTGFVSRNVEEMASSVAEATRLDRRHVRAAAQRRFDIDRVARDYSSEYARAKIRP